MQRIAGLFCLLLLASPILARADGAQRVMPLSSPLYELIDALYLEQGMAHANMARPWTAEEASSILGRIDPGPLSPAGSNAYTEGSRLLRWEPGFSEGAYSLRAGIELTVEAFEHVNIDRDGEARDLDYSWQHGYEERKSLLKIPLAAEYGDALFLEAVIEAKEERNAVGDPASDGTLMPGAVLSNHFNLIFDDAEPWLDLYFPFKALASLGGEWWNLRFGRDELSWGNGHSGNLMLSDYSDFYDFIGLELYSRRLKFSSAYAVMDAFGPHGASLTYSAFLGHRLDIRLWDRVLISLNESVTFANSQPDLIRDLNPLWALTSPWLYNRRAAPYYYNVRRYWSLITDRFEYVTKFLGYEYGSDALVWYLEVGYSIPGSWKAGLDICYSLRGEKGPGADWNPVKGDQTPSGIAEMLLVVRMGAEYPLADWLSLGTELYASDPITENMSWATSPGTWSYPCT
jgi:hypothetical protein